MTKSCLSGQAVALPMCDLPPDVTPQSRGIAPARGQRSLTRFATCGVTLRRNVHSTDYDEKSLWMAGRQSQSVHAMCLQRHSPTLRTRFVPARGQRSLTRFTTCGVMLRRNVHQRVMTKSRSTIRRSQVARAKRARTTGLYLNFSRTGSDALADCRGAAPPRAKSLLYLLQTAVRWSRYNGL